MQEEGSEPCSAASRALLHGARSSAKLIQTIRLREGGRAAVPAGGGGRLGD
eukprot:CAMPEP_0206005852 /NCGR_PEP_ID=MMETSP1464-20131121/4831_1 /ASSEMBLY_ACC=CAM_ASM_001124 /TAXON_ID=119497 /ORGANISM="Exanthemachrysis gayraliae, Strain RCC1523" /LENGTH=50 /DNA_ID=CAMNT_0053379311 /DNA_START=192 /DNA_END=344 /DNA_ORIENTATION=+